jgi:hypothetical protein
MTATTPHTFIYFLFFRPILTGFTFNLRSTGILSADAGSPPPSVVGCFGGANGGSGGGDNASPAMYLSFFCFLYFKFCLIPHIQDDISMIYNPSTYGQPGGNCSALNSASVLGGGVVHVIAAFLTFDGKITANGEPGGAGGSVWIQTGLLTAGLGASITAEGNTISHGTYLFYSLFYFILRNLKINYVYNRVWRWWAGELFFCATRTYTRRVYEQLLYYIFIIYLTYTVIIL